MKMANCILVNNNFMVKPNFMTDIQKLASVLHRSFEDNTVVAIECNQIIKEGTNGLITDPVKADMIDTKTVMILINTLYFKTVWASPFKEYATKDKFFNETKMVKMMSKTKDFPYYEDDNVQIVDMMYQGNEYSMLWVLPKPGVEMSKCYGYLFNYVEFGYERVECEIPKFTQRKNYSLKPLMQEMGVTDIFSEEMSRLDHMTDERVYVSEAIHEAVVIVDEAGTEAAAVTVAICKLESCCMPPDPIPFYLHRPFLYGIKDRKNNMILFAGDYHGPE